LCEPDYIIATKITDNPLAVRERFPHSGTTTSSCDIIRSTYKNLGFQRTAVPCKSITDLPTAHLFRSTTSATAAPKYKVRVDGAASCERGKKNCYSSERYVLICVTVLRGTAKTTKEECPELKSDKSEGCISSGRAKSQARARSPGHLRRFVCGRVRK
jgi:hypothetical protein